MTQEADRSPGRLTGDGRGPRYAGSVRRHPGPGQQLRRRPGAQAARPGARQRPQGAGGPPARKPQGRPSLGGGTPAQDRELRAQGRETVRKLLEAGTIEFEERGFNGVRVDDVVKRAGISHGTFYLYFANKEDLFKALLRDALHDMEIVAGDFPVVTSDEHRAAACCAVGAEVLRRLRGARHRAAHAQLGRTRQVEMFADGLQLFFSLTEAMTTGMTAAAAAAGRASGERRADRVRLPDDARAGQLRDDHRGAAAVED